MSRYFFDLNEAGDVTVDHEGCDLPDLGAARDRAVREARDLMCGDVLSGKLCLNFEIRIRDETDAMVLVVPFADALETIAAPAGVVRGNDLEDD